MSSISERERKLMRSAFEAGRARGMDERKGPNCYPDEINEPDFDEWVYESYGVEE